MTVLYRKPYSSMTNEFVYQGFFEAYNWDNLNLGEIVWLEDYHKWDCVNTIAGVFVGHDDFGNPVIELLPNDIAYHLANIEYLW